MIQEISLPSKQSHPQLSLPPHPQSSYCSNDCCLYLTTFSFPISEPSLQHRLLSLPHHILCSHLRALSTAPTAVTTSTHHLFPFQSPHYSTDCFPYLTTSSVPISEPSLQHRLLVLHHHILCSHRSSLTTALTAVSTSPHPLSPPQSPNYSTDGCPYPTTSSVPISEP